MARPFMFAALCQRAHPLKHSLAVSIFVSRVQKTAKKIFVSRKIRQQGHSLAEVSLQSLLANLANAPNRWTGFIRLRIGSHGSLFANRAVRHRVPQQSDDCWTVSQQRRPQVTPLLAISSLQCMYVCSHFPACSRLHVVTGKSAFCLYTSAIRFHLSPDQTPVGTDAQAAIFLKRRYSVGIRFVFLVQRRAIEFKNVAANVWYTGCFRRDSKYFMRW